MPFLVNQMVKLCCDTSTFDEFMGVAKLWEPAQGGKPFEAVQRVLNKYTTTLHVINSAVVKLGKLTVATKVYRGISGRVLPQQFWKANEFGVKGGIESAFMSVSTDRKIAMQYAAGGGAGFVLEIQQGMIDRGADISFCSQCECSGIQTRAVVPRQT